ncbi:unnamed protein product [Moneuplotes crassus]|uniref:Uncharacterized protein n=1 Tax=Euplotes crassus TaxID=5936 RepID=A0AAD1UDT0_EUPCR|nr:unnamed protein product [Moneuplotes crassus]
MYLLSIQLIGAVLFFLFVYNLINKLFFVEIESFEYFYEKEGRFLITDNFSSKEIKQKINQRLQEGLEQRRKQIYDSSEELLSISDVQKTNLSFKMDRLHSEITPGRK